MTRGSAAPQPGRAGAPYGRRAAGPAAEPSAIRTAARAAGMLPDGRAPGGPAAAAADALGAPSAAARRAAVAAQHPAAGGGHHAADVARRGAAARLRRHRPGAQRSAGRQAARPRRARPPAASPWPSEKADRQTVTRQRATTAPRADGQDRGTRLAERPGASSSPAAARARSHVVALSSDSGETPVASRGPPGLRRASARRQRARGPAAARSTRAGRHVRAVHARSSDNGRATSPSRRLIVGTRLNDIERQPVSSCTTSSRSTQEEQTLDLVEGHAGHGRAVRRGPARRHRLARRAAGRHARADGRGDRRAALRRPAPGADEGQRRGRHRPARRGVQRDGAEPPAEDPAAGGAVPGAAPVRLGRLARAAHAADHRADGRRRHARGARATSTRRPRAPPSCCGDQLDRFEALLTDLLEISRFDAGAAALEAEPIDLRDVVRRVDRRRRAAGRAQGHPDPGAIGDRAAGDRRGRPPPRRAGAAQPGRQRRRARRGPGRRGAAGGRPAAPSRSPSATTASG